MDPCDLSMEHPAPGLSVFQPRRGFRYSMDPFILAAWALDGGTPATVLDLGTGCGIMALLLARLGFDVTGFDVQPRWISMARLSAAASGLHVDFRLGDVRALPPMDADLAVMNPPYFPVGRGHLSPDPCKAAARMELNGDLEELTLAGARLARRLCMVLPLAREPDGMAGIRRAGMYLSRCCQVGSSIVLLEGLRCKRAVQARDQRRVTRMSVPMRTGNTFSAQVKAWYERLGAGLWERRT